MYVHVSTYASSPVVWGFDVEAMKVLQEMQQLGLGLGREGGLGSSATSRNSFTTAAGAAAAGSNKYQKLFREGVMEAREEEKEEEGEGEGEREGSRPATEDGRQQNTQGVGGTRAPVYCVVSACICMYVCE